MIRPDELLVFDFDGVISNSIHDSFRTAVNTYLPFRTRPEFPLNEPLDSDNVFQFEADHSRFFRAFEQLMPLGNFPEDYYVICHILEHEKAAGMKDQSVFNSYKDRLPPEKLGIYQERFYAYRAHCQHVDPEAWSGLLPPFPGIVEAIETLSDRFILAIATSKDRASVDILLRRYLLENHFDPANILAKDFARSKRDQLIHLRHRYSIPFSSIHFIDDKILHLMPVKDLGVIAYLALWGFNTEREALLARSNAIIPLDLEDLPALLPRRPA